MEQYRPMPFGMGELIKLGNIFLTVNNFGVTMARNPNNKLLTIDVTIENEGIKAIEYDSKEFMLRGREGYIYHQIEPKEKLILSKRILPAYSKVKDQVIFEIPLEAYVELIYQPIWWTGNQIIIELR